MRLVLQFAWRYLVGKKSTQAIHVISGIAVLGVTIATAAMIIVLSVFNGFEGLITQMINQFNPDIKVIPAEGKQFEPDPALFTKLKDVPGVDRISFTLEETALFEYDGIQDFGMIKGVDDEYRHVTMIDSGMVQGKFQTKDSLAYFAVLGAGMKSKLGVSIRDLITPVFVYLPNKKQRGPLDKPFVRRSLYPSGVFQLEQEVDYSYVFTSLDFVQKMLDLDGQVGAAEISATEGTNITRLKKAVKEVLGPEFEVSDRFDQQEEFLKLMNTEKLVSFAILSFILIIVSFNLVGSLWMIALEKRQDVSVLKAMGADDRLIGRIFRIEGLLLVGIGLVVGFLLAIAFYLIQINYGILSIPDGFLVQSYPIELEFMDFFWVFLVVIMIGWLSTYFPVKRAMSTPSFIREE